MITAICILFGLCVVARILVAIDEIDIPKQRNSEPSPDDMQDFD